MGGFGSGRRFSKRATTNDFKRLDVRWLYQQNRLRENSTGGVTWSRNGTAIGDISYRVRGETLVLLYRVRSGGSDWESYEYPVALELTPCTFGGTRVWFRCPARGCGRRCAVLFGGAIFACRRCHRLAYESQNQTDANRAADRAWSLLERLKCDKFMSILDSEPFRPKGMHQKTFSRLSRLYEAKRLVALSDAPAGFDLNRW